MIQIRLDRFALGALAEELGVPIQTGPDSYGRETHIQIFIDVLIGAKSKVRFHSIAPKKSAVQPPEFRAVIV